MKTAIQSTTQVKAPYKKDYRDIRARRQDDNRGRGFKFLWAIFPDFWKKSWGDKPCLGKVRADSEFDAIRAAYDNKLLTYNFTFGPRPILIQTKD